MNTYVVKRVTKSGIELSKVQGKGIGDIMFIVNPMGDLPALGERVEVAMDGAMTTVRHRKGLMKGTAEYG